MKGILIFIKNPILGKAKTRLAKDIGNEKAHEIYLELLNHTKNITLDLDIKKLLYYSWSIDDADQWDAQVYDKKLQNPSTDLGIKMHDAFQEAFSQGLEQVLIIGSDCYDLSQNLIEEGFRQLETNEAIIGPAWDGGYYLIGLNKSIIQSRLDIILDSLFLKKAWSHDHVGQEAISSFKKHNLTFATLPTLRDIDTANDLTGKLLGIANREN